MNVTDENRDPSYWEVPGKELDQILRKMVIKRLHDEAHQNYQELQEQYR